MAALHAGNRLWGCRATINSGPVKSFTPRFHSDYRERKGKGLLPIRHIGVAENFVDLLFRERLASATPQPEVQAAFGRMIDLPMEDERIDTGKMRGAVIGIGVGGRLDLFSIRAIRAVETLL